MFSYETLIIDKLKNQGAKTKGNENIKKYGSGR
jgi:hypothetical protein